MPWRRAENWHPLIAAGSTLSGWGALLSENLTVLFGFALTLIGLWLAHRENRRHERAMAEVRRPTPSPPPTPGPPGA